MFRNRKKGKTMPIENLEEYNARQAKALEQFYDDFVVPMLKDKVNHKTFGGVTFYLESEFWLSSPHCKWVREINFNYGKLFAFYLSFKREIITKGHSRAWEYWTGNEDNPFRNIGVYFSYDKKLVYCGLCKYFHGSLAQLHSKEGTLKIGRNTQYGIMTSDMMCYEDEHNNPMSKWIKFYLSHKDEKLFINRKEYKNVILAQKKMLGVRSIAQLHEKGLGILQHTDNIFGSLYVSEQYYKGSDLQGDASNICGDISRICGVIHKGLTGDVSGLSGIITNLYGDATGITLDIPKKLNKPTNISDFIHPDIIKYFHLISNEDNQTLLKVWNVLAHHTIGVTDEERFLFDHPKKCKPPFDVDRWGRKYVVDKTGEYAWVFSINPADIMFAKDVNKCSTCFCINSGSKRWEFGMRCLISLNCINPNLGVAFKIRRNSVKKMNQFNGIKFKWYEPENATFFQYDSEKLYIWNSCCFSNGFSLPAKLCEWSDIKPSIKPIYGHDGCNCGHERQESLAYLETFIKDGYKWYRGEDKTFPLTNNDRDFTKDEISDEWKAQIELANAKAEQLVKELKDK